MHLKGSPILFLVLISAFPGLAGTVYQQPPTYVPPNGATTFDWTISLLSGVGGDRSFDNFTLGGDAAINGAEWYAFAWDYGTPANNPTTPDTTSWDIGFYADNGGTPGTQLYSVSIPVASVTATLLGTTPFNGSNVNVYRFDATLPSTFDAGAGTTYWFAPLSIQPDTQAVLLSWINGTGGDGTTIQQNLDGSGNVTGMALMPDDRAFSLFATPEPGTFALLGTALLGLAACRKRSAR